MIIIAIIAAVLLTVAIQLAARNMAMPEKKVEALIHPDYSFQSGQFFHEINVLLGPPVVQGNRVEILNNGDEIFPSMLEAISSAKISITFETFIYWSGEVGEKFAEAFAERARAGVEVKVLIDWVGSRILGSHEEEVMREAGVDLQIYRPLNWYHLGRINHRTHRKILVVDGIVGYTGGVGIADQWRGDVRKGDPSMEWRDFHFRIYGPVVAQMQSVFVNNWVKATGCSLHGEIFFPGVSEEGDVPMQCFHSSPNEGSESVRLMFLYMIECARESLDVSAAYFLPDPLMRKALCEARERGVEIRVILPGRNNDVRAVTHASRELWGDLLEAGVRVFRFTPSMYHCKALIADRQVVSIGSSNFDNRSFRLNDEMNVNVFDPEFAAAMTRIFEEDLERSSEVTLAEWRRRPRWTRCKDWFYAKFRAQL